MGLFTAAAIAAIVGAGAAVVGAVSQGQAQARQASTQAGIYRQQADRERQDAAGREEDYRRTAERQLATRRALLGASGVEPGAGSPLLVSEDMTSEAELQALRIRSGGEAQATRMEQGAGFAQAAGRNARTGGFMRAGAELLAGTANVAYRADKKYNDPYYGQPRGTPLGVPEL